MTNSESQNFRRALPFAIPLLLILIVWIILSIVKDPNDESSPTTTSPTQKKAQVPIKSSPNDSLKEKNTQKLESEEETPSPEVTSNFPHTLFGQIESSDNNWGMMSGSATALLDSGKTLSSRISVRNKNYKIENLEGEQVRVLFEVPGYPVEVHDIPLKSNKRSTQFNLTLKPPKIITVRIQDGEGNPFIRSTHNRKNNPLPPLLNKIIPLLNATLKVSEDNPRTLHLSSRRFHYSFFAKEVFQKARKLPSDGKKDTLGYLKVRQTENQEVHLLVGHDIIDTQEIVNDEVIFKVTKNLVVPLQITVIGTIIDQSGVPISGAKITFNPEGERGKGVESSAKGKFTWKHLGSGVYPLIIEKAGFFTVRKLIPISATNAEILDIGNIKLTPLPITPTPIQIDSAHLPDQLTKLFVNPSLNAQDFQNPNTLLRTWHCEKISVALNSTQGSINISKIPSNPFNIVLTSRKGLLYATSIHLQTNVTEPTIIKLPEEFFNIALKFKYKAEYEYAPATLFDSQLRPLKNFVVKAGAIHKLKLAKGTYKLIFFSTNSEAKILDEVELEVTKSELVETP